MRCSACGATVVAEARLFRYHLVGLEVDSLPDEEWATDSPQVLSKDEAMARRILQLASQTPAHTWGRRVRGTSEMWTSDSVVSWLLVQAGVDIAAIRIPEGGRAPGWIAGVELATRQPPA